MEKIEQLTIDMGGVENVSIKLAAQARKDFIKGGKILYDLLGYIPTQKDLRNSKYKTMDDDPDVHWMYDAWLFVKRDPYDLFSNFDEYEIITSWKQDAILSYYKDKYLSGAIVLYFKKAAKKKPIYKLAESTLKRHIKDTSIRDKFIDAKNYICKLPDYEKYFKEWDEIAEKKSKFYTKSNKRKDIYDVANNRNLVREQKMKDREKRVLRIKELMDAGFTIQAMAADIGCSTATIYDYIKEAKALS